MLRVEHFPLAVVGSAPRHAVYAVGEIDPGLFVLAAAAEVAEAAAATGGVPSCLADLVFLPHHAQHQRWRLAAFQGLDYVAVTVLCIGEVPAAHAAAAIERWRAAGASAPAAKAKPEGRALDGPGAGEARDVG